MGGQLTYGYGPGPGDPQFPYGAGPGGPYGPPPGYGPPPLNYPSGPTNPLAIASIVLAFLCAPAGAVTGHLALRQIRRRLQRGRDLAVIGLTLSYTMIVLTVAALVFWTVMQRPDTDQPPVASPQEPPAAGTSTTPPPPRPDLSKILLSAAEIGTLIGDPDLAPPPAPVPGSGPGAGGQGPSGLDSYDPVECAGAVLPGLDTVYRDSGKTEVKRAMFQHLEKALIIEELAVSFASPARARLFLDKNAQQWQKCAGTSVRLTTPPNSLVYGVGTPTVTPDRIAVSDTIPGYAAASQRRIMAVKGAVVIDLGMMSIGLGDSLDKVADELLARVPG